MIFNLGGLPALFVIRNTPSEIDAAKGLWGRGRPIQFYTLQVLQEKFPWIDYTLLWGLPERGLPNQVEKPGFGKGNRPPANEAGVHRKAIFFKRGAHHHVATRDSVSSRSDSVG